MRKAQPFLRAVFATIAYADIFDFPLLPEEVTRYLVGVAATERAVRKELSHLAGRRSTKDAYCLLPGRARLAALRETRRRASQKKWVIAYRVARWLRYIPSIDLVGVTGALAMDNAGEGDDIDLFLIVKPHTLWISRLLAVFVVDIVGKRRRPGDPNVKDAICLNMFMTGNALGVQLAERDLYTAHEVLQMAPLWERGNAYGRFLSENRWVSEFLPNYWNGTFRQARQDWLYPVGAIVRSFCSLFLSLVNPLARLLELRYMAKRRTREVVNDTELRFHPRDTRGFVLKELTARFDEANIPLDNVFLGSIK